MALTIFLLTGTPNDAVIDGPKNIIAEWPSLKSAGFNIIDAILPNPLNTEQVYFFSGDQYALIHVQQGGFPSLRFVPEPGRADVTFQGQTKTILLMAQSRSGPA